MAIVFPGELGAPLKPDIEFIESFDNSQVGGVEKFGSVSGNTASQSTLISKSGPLTLKRIAVAVSYATTVDDFIIGVTSTAAARTITISTTDLVDGRILIIKDESGAANVNNITIDPEGGATIDGAATKVINTAYGVVGIYSDAVNWFTW